MIEREPLETFFNRHDCTDFRWIETERIIVSHWVRMKCMFGCEGFGKRATCPPNLPTVSECEQLFREYKHAVIFHFQKRFTKPKDRFDWYKAINKKLLNLEREVFLAGYHKAFMMLVYPCNLCKTCTSNITKCKNHKWARPSPEGMAVDVFSTARALGFPIDVLKDYDQKMNRYGLLLIE